MSKLEQVVAVRNKNVSKPGFSPAPEYLSLEDIFEPQDIMIGSRAWLETDENFLQLIPYCMVTAGGRILAYARTPKGGEARLSNKVSVGVGGHINGFDTVPSNTDESIIGVSKTVFRSAYRELAEELKLPVDIDDAYALEFQGLLYNPADEVGRVHLGLLMTCELNPELHDKKHRITSEDAGLKILGFFDKEYLLAAEEFELEPWSRMALEGLK